MDPLPEDKTKPQQPAGNAQNQQNLRPRTTAHYEVDQWTLEAGQEDQLSTPGARLKATGLPRQWGNGPSDTSGCRRRW